MSQATSNYRALRRHIPEDSIHILSLLSDHYFDINELTI
jgi:hypothetical protein